VGETGSAVYRDPVERAISLYNHHVWSPENRRDYFKAMDLFNCSPDRYVDFIASELGKSDPLNMDEHIRPQSYYYDPATQVDEVVLIENLDAFMLAKFGIEAMERINESSEKVPAPPAFSDELKARLKELYAVDYGVFAGVGEPVPV